MYKAEGYDQKFPFGFSSSVIRHHRFAACVFQSPEVQLQEHRSEKRSLWEKLASF